MAYIHVKKVGNKKYYTLRVSLRSKAGKVITKDLENLGNNISKIKFEELEKKHKKEIRLSYKTIKRFLESNYYLEKAKKQKLKKGQFFGKEQLEELEAVKLHFHTKFSKIDKKTMFEVYEFFLIKFAVSSTSIEGNTINISQASKLLKEEILPKGKTSREVYDLQNTKRVFFKLLEERPEITLELIEKVHDELLDRIDERKGYRKHDIKIFGQPFNPTPAAYVKEDIKMLVKWYNLNKNKIQPLALAILFHHKFESIHPFSDGNGRTGRILMNQILINLGYPPMIISKSKRDEYLNHINKADNDIKKDLLNISIQNSHGLFDFMLDEFLLTYWNTFLV